VIGGDFDDTAAPPWHGSGMTALFREREQQEVNLSGSSYSQGRLTAWEKEMHSVQ